MKTITTLLFFLITLTSPLTEYMSGDYVIYQRITNDSQYEFFCPNAVVLTKFLGQYNTESSLIFDMDGSGVVSSNDLLAILSGYGLETSSVHLQDISIIQQYSHGWFAEYPGAYTCFVHPTLTDEVGDTLQSFWVEYVYQDSIVKEWVYRVE